MSKVVFSPDGSRVASASWDQTVRIWDAATGAPLACLCGHENGVDSVAFSPDGSRIASAGDETVRIWDAATGAPLACLCGHENGVTSVAFSADGSRIASGSSDQTVRVWDVATGAPLVCLCGHEKTVYSVAFSPDGARIASAAYDETVRIWDAATGHCLEVIPGRGKRVAILGSIIPCYDEEMQFVSRFSSGAERFPYRALVTGPETVIESAEDGQILAWFPVAFAEDTHPSGRLWVGGSNNQVLLVRLEGYV